MMEGLFLLIIACVNCKDRLGDPTKNEYSRCPNGTFKHNGKRSDKTLQTIRGQCFVMVCYVLSMYVRQPYSQMVFVFEFLQSSFHITIAKSKFAILKLPGPCFL